MLTRVAVGLIALSSCVLGCFAAENVQVAELQGRLAECHAQRQALEARLVASPLAAPAPAPPAPAAPCAPTLPATPPPEPPTCFDVVVVDPGPNKLNVVKIVKTLTGQGLLEAKTLVDSPPATIQASTSKEVAEAMRAQLVEAGATVNLAPVPCP
jgi:large subunit ribosomal protein L7/L12